MAKTMQRIIEILDDLMKAHFTGWIKINFHKGIVGKIEKGPNYIE
ncbi:hypothetical protein ACFL6E_06305 [Candidatus Neomarinimicrobiota bacterium]